MNNLLSALVLAVSSLAGVSVSSDVIADSSVMGDLSTCEGFDPADFPGNPLMERVQNVGGDMRLLTVADGSDGWDSVYLYFFHPSAKPLLYWDKDLNAYTGSAGCQVKMSVYGSYDSPVWRDCSLVDVSDDGLFYKMKVSSPAGFGFDSSSVLRGYMFDSFGVLDYAGARSFSYALGDSFEFTGSSLVHSVFEAVSLSPLYYSFIIPGVNSHSGDTFYGGTFETSDVYSEVFSGLFSVPDFFGDCVGLRMSWTASQWLRDFTVGISGPTDHGATSVPIYGITPKDNVVDFRDSMSRKVLGWDDAQASKAGFFYKLYTGWGAKGANDWEFPVLSKVNPFLNGKLYYELQAQSYSDNPCLLPDEDVAAQGLAMVKPGSSLYCIHFDVRDFQVTNGVSFRSSPSGMIWDIVDYLNGYFSTGSTYFWDMSNISILTLTMKRDGVEYILHVSDDEGHVSGDDAPLFAKQPDWLKELLRILLIGGCVFLAVYVVYRLIRGARGKARNGRR